MTRSIQTLILTIITFVVLTALAADTVSVSVRKTSIRTESRFYAPAVEEAVYKDELQVLMTVKDWIKVSKNGKEGWIHVSAVSSIAVAASSSESELSSEYSEEEIALAGKGFSEQVEEQYRQDNPELAFATVDEMEKYAVPLADVIAFQTKGKLIARERAP